ncbi:helix-turn-helix transcriptional regulator [Colwellia sp. 12G3]|uniref:helix-turn-helix transcriptional regulator n=1 Tax=Colwellia sp. 12G3 TaxID=2058299 RepID=UPI001E2EFBEA|nr:LuxR C-terminal-related transcriptional regulator [Colwellia sp. 12G3]
MSFRLYLPAIVLAFAMAFFIFDIVSDVLSNEDGFLHLSLEFMVFIAISVVLFRELQHVKSLKKVIVIEKSKTARLAGELLQVMKEQFAKWQLTPSECEVSLLLIKGLSMKEIAEARQVKEKTVRGQATAIYAKANCAGRHELAAYFIEDLMREV